MRKNIPYKNTSVNIWCLVLVFSHRLIQWKEHSLNKTAGSIQVSLHLWLSFFGCTHKLISNLARLNFPSKGLKDWSEMKLTNGILSCTFLISIGISDVRLCSVFGSGKKKKSHIFPNLNDYKDLRRRALTKRWMNEFIWMDPKSNSNNLRINLSTHTSLQTIS